jgi:uncharacterized protein
VVARTFGPSPRDTARAMSENLDLVRSIYSALNNGYASGNYTTAAAFSHPDIVLRTSGMFPETGEYRGYDAVRRFTENQAQAFESMYVEPREYIEAGHRVVVPIRFGGKARTTGIRASFDVVHVWTIRDGKVSELAIYRDRGDALKFAGLKE